MQKNRLIYLLMVAALLLLTPFAAAQQDDAGENGADAPPAGEETAAEAEAEEEMPEIPYFQSTRRFNVPVLENWENQSEGAVAQFTQPEYDATIRVTVVDTTDITEAAAQAVAPIIGDDLPGSPLVTDSINLPDGTWNQAVYQQGDVTLSTLARVDGSITYVISFLETSTDYDIALLAVRGDDPEAAARGTLETLYEEPIGDPIETDNPDTPADGTWVRSVYEVPNGDVLVYTYIFGGVNYLAIGTGDEGAVITLAEAFTSLFLGFFVTPDNSPYLILGLVVSLAILVILIGSIYLRYRSARRDMQIVEELRSE